ncbi:hypothetical protein BBEV_3321 [Salisediminibacterium beveridgei]|uniref:Uncharacterized protein n=2 Tax=Salisediminibacterium beveridgei TaxID=632773 RepID=A0A1D7R033_9BACI|nr:hypothetical protein BBEV_3321 [Salisediminibacterium beveridgei]
MWLSLAALLAKMLSALYKVPYQNMTGDAGFYVYQQVYPLYGVALVLGAYGYPLVLATMMGDSRTASAAERAARFRFLYLTLIVLHLLAAVLVWLSAPGLAWVMGDLALAGPMRWMSLPFLVIPVLAFHRGVFQGMGRTGPSAASQVLEQVLRVTVILLLAGWVTWQGGSAYEAGVSAGAGAFAGGLGGAVWLMLRMQRTDPLFTEALYRSGQPIVTKAWKKDLITLIKGGFFVSLSALALVSFQLVDAFTVYRGLVASGEAHVNAAAFKGIYDRSWPLIQFGAVVTTVFSYAVVPVVSRLFEARNRTGVQQEIHRAVAICLVFGGAAAAGLAVIMPSVNTMLFMDQAGNTALRIASLSILPGALFMTVAVLWHALDQSGRPAKWLLSGLAVKGLLNVLLIPVFGIIGAAVASVTGLVFMAVMVTIALCKDDWFTGVSPGFTSKWVLSLVVMAIGAFGVEAAGRYFFGADPVRSEALVTGVGAAVLGAVIFVLMIWRIRLFDEATWSMLPLIGSRLPYKN